MKRIRTWFILVIPSIAPLAAAGVEDFHTVTLAECEMIALLNHSAIQLAKEEVTVSRAKTQEALRTLFPSVTAKAEETQGRALDPRINPDFTEKSYGIEVVQPIFQGGRFFRTFKQSFASLEASRAKQTKVEQEVLYKVRESYWNLVKAQRVLEIYSKTLKSLEKEKTTADRLLQNDVITAQVYMVINSQYQQFLYQFESAKAEEQLRLWQWAEALGQKILPKTRPDPGLEIVMKEDLSLDECLSAAMAAHPDLKIQGQVLTAARQGFLSARSRFWPHLDVSGFFGKSAAAFKSENLNFREDWQLGFKFSMQFGGSAVQGSGLRQKTSPKIGQSSRTDSETVSAAVGILDSLKSRSEQKEAKFAFHQAKAQMDAVEMEIQNGVREAYAGSRKSFAQLKISENDLALALTEMSVAEIKSSHREAPISERSLARGKLTQAEVDVAQARSAYFISLAALNRAVGLPYKF